MKQTFEKVNFSVSAPDESGINVIRDTGKSLGYIFRISVIHGHPRVLPILWTLEKVSFISLVRESSINVSWQAGPSACDRLWKSLGKSAVGQLPIIITCQTE